MCVMPGQPDGLGEEQRRQDAVAEYGLGGEGREPEFDSVTELAADLLAVPLALVTVLSTDQQLFKGAAGLETAATRRDVAFCNHTVEQTDVFIVEDAAADLQFASNPLVTGEPHIRFYAGAPIRVSSGVAVGAL